MVVVTVGMFMYKRRQAFLTAMKRKSVHTYELFVSYVIDGSIFFRQSRRHHRNNEYDAPNPVRFNHQWCNNYDCFRF